jgi:hypothetical protein
VGANHIVQELRTFRSGLGPADVVFALSELGKSFARGDEFNKSHKRFVTWIRNPGPAVERGASSPIKQPVLHTVGKSSCWKRRVRDSDVIGSVSFGFLGDDDDVWFGG